MKTLDEVTLSQGGHATAEAGMCLLELTSYLAGEQFSYSPHCVSPVLAAFGRALNDGTLFASHLDELKALAPRLVGTAAPWGVDWWRICLLVDWSVRTLLPLLMDSLGRSDVAADLQRLAPIRGYALARAAARGIRAVQAAYVAERVAWAVESMEAVAYAAESLATITCAADSMEAVAWAGDAVSWVSEAMDEAALLRTSAIAIFERAIAVC